MKRDFDRELFPDTEFVNETGKGYYFDTFPPDPFDDDFSPGDYSIEMEADEAAEDLMEDILDGIERAEEWEACSGILVKPVCERLILMLKKEIEKADVRMAAEAARAVKAHGRSGTQEDEEESI